MTKDELLAAVGLAGDILLEGGATPRDGVTLARAVESLWAATKHYEGCITWEASCMRCSVLLNRLHLADRHAEEAEAALAVALARRSA